MSLSTRSLCVGLPSLLFMAHVSYCTCVSIGRNW